MIRNIVFDMGNVLFGFEPAKFVKKYVADADDALQINDVLFSAPEWTETDRGLLSDEDYLKIVLPRLPERLRRVAGFLFNHWDEMPVPYGEVEDLIRTLKAGGYRIYLLSNISSRFYRFYRRIPAMKYFDGMIVSADVHAIKPEPEIYRELFERFGLKPEECFFIDDRPENVKGGEPFGMKGFCYRQNVEELRSSLAGAGVRV